MVRSSVVKKQNGLQCFLVPQGERILHTMLSLLPWKRRSKQKKVMDESQEQLLSKH